MPVKSEEKIFPNLVLALTNTLKAIFIDQRYADKALEYTLHSNKKWGARDRAFIAENTYDIVRNFRLLQFVYGNTELSETAFKNYFAILKMHKGSAFDSVKMYTELSEQTIQQKLQEAKNSRAIRASIPDWLDELGSKELGALWDKELDALNTTADVVLRANTIKTSRSALKEILDQENIETRTIEGDALVLVRRQNVFGSRGFREGLFEVQDASSQLVAPALDVQPGMRVIDACAGGGGKALHIAALMKNKGKIIALDTEEWKLNNLKKRAARADIQIIETKVIEGNKTIKRLENSADRLLLDVPCSGLGVLKRNPDAKWKLKPEFIEEIKRTQSDILNQYTSMLKPGGLLVYSTCSILPSENRNQVDLFLKGNSNFSLIKDQSVLPSSGYDGFYIAVLKKNA